MEAGTLLAPLARAVGAPENGTRWKVVDACFHYHE